MSGNIFHAGRIPTAIRRAAFAPHLKIDPGVKTLRLGTEYGGWDFVDAANLHASTIISCGLGEDASFDVAFASRYGAKVVMVDPTPRAIAHFQAIRGNIGQQPRCAFVPGGNQPVEAYDLSELGSDSLTLVDRAMWTEERTLRFYAPQNPSYVSHSITNYFNSFSVETPYIEVQSIAIDALMAQIRTDTIPLIKLDIEGAEVTVIADMLRKGIRPDQILVEFDELSVYSRRSKTEIEGTDRALRANGYQLVHFRKPSNFLYLKNR